MPLHPLEIPLPSHEQSRADLYALLARLLLAPPDDALLSAVAQAPPLGGAATGAAAAGVEADPYAEDGTPLGRAWDALRSAARGDGEAVRERFDALFVSAGQPLLNPYASLYLAGFLMDTPLALLRQALARLGLRRRAGVGEPEDHLGALCEVMRLLITGAPGLPRRTPAQQAEFFETHLASWAGRCLEDIETADAGGFYAALAGFMRAFLELETLAFELEDTARSAETATA
ncbi:TorD/DmsD family molecular chaperone [Azohydromonas australica]|uniref:TorD/DmsD family molecular chaperone n=1 Tax=Azohydromonas australica TaxID=364039 RepID=UPI0005BCE297|nr:molecular chaperone TorD family protein [Azohydromonas australica]